MPISAEDARKVNQEKLEMAIGKLDALLEKSGKGIDVRLVQYEEMKKEMEARFNLLLHFLILHNPLPGYVDSVSSGNQSFDSRNLTYPYQ